MTSEWQYQVRFDLNDPTKSESVRRRLDDPALTPLFVILAKHRGPKCQFDAFADYVATAEAQGVESHPLYQWTKATIENPAKREKYLKSFTVYVDDREVYAKEIADALEADLQPLATRGLIARISKYDSNPARRSAGVLARFPRLCTSTSSTLFFSQVLMMDFSRVQLGGLAPRAPRPGLPGDRTSPPPPPTASG